MSLTGAHQVGDNGHTADHNLIDAQLNALGANTPQRNGGTTSTAAVLPTVNAADYGAVGDASTDCTTALTNAIGHLPFGGVVLLPAGDFHYSTLTLPGGVWLQGQDRVSSALTCTNATGTGISVTGSASGLRHLKLGTSVTRTSGALLSVQGNGFRAEHVDFTGYYLGAVIGTVGSPVIVGVTFSDCTWFNGATGLGGAGLSFDNFSNFTVDRCIMSGPTSGTQPTSGIRVGNGDTGFISHTNITLHGKALIVNPGAGLNCYGLTITGCFFDSAGTISGGSTVPSGDFSPAGNVLNTQISNTWFGLSASQQGLNILPSGSGTVDGMQLTGCQFVKNASDGLLIAGAGCKNITITGGLTTGNTTNGLRLAAACTYITVVGLRAGDAAGRGPNNVGITITASAVDNYLITACNLRGNTTASISDSGTGTNKSVTANLT